MCSPSSIACIRRSPAIGSGGVSADRKLYAMEELNRGKPPELPHTERQLREVPTLVALRAWLAVALT